MKRKQRKNSRERKEEGLVKTRARGILLILALCLSMVGTSVVYAEEAASPPGAYQDEGQDQSQDSEDTGKDTEKEDDSGGGEKKKDQNSGTETPGNTENTGSAVTSGTSENPGST